MNTTSTYLDELQELLLRPSQSIVEIVEQLLTICHDHHLQLEWQESVIRVRQPEGQWEQIGEASMRKSVFRAILARLAAMCNEQVPDSVSPYGGLGKLLVSENLQGLIRFSFVNTSAEQRLELTAGNR